MLSVDARYRGVHPPDGLSDMAPTLTLTRYYKGLVREEVIARWASALRSGAYAQGNKVLHRPVTNTLRRNPGEFDVYGVLCHSLELPKVLETQPDGRLLFAYGDTRNGPYSSTMLPDELHRFLVRKGRAKLVVDLPKLVTDSPVLFSKITFDTGLDRKTLMLMEPTLATLNDLGVKFGTLSLLIESGHW